MGSFGLLVAFSLLAISEALVPATFELTPQGIKAIIPANNLYRAAIHYKINEPLHGVDPANFSKDFDASSLNGADHWEWINDKAKGKPGDIIYYWLWGESSSGGSTLTDQMFIIPQTTTSTTTTPTTTTPTTTPRTTTSTITTTTTTTTPPTTTPRTTTSTITTTTTTTTSPFTPTPLVSGTYTVQGNLNGTTLKSGNNVTTTTSIPFNAANGTTTSFRSNTTISMTPAGSNATGSNSNMSGGSNSSIFSSGSDTCSTTDGSCCKKVVTCQSYPCLIFQDDFDTLNLCVWEHEITAGGRSDSEFQYYTNNRSNSYVRNGTLFIKPTLTSDNYGEEFLTSGTLDLWGGFNEEPCTSNAYSGCKREGSVLHPINPIQSARLRSKRGFSMKYGKVEIEAKMPKGDWIWPAIKMLPMRDAYGRWPASGKIDIVESRGNENYHDMQKHSKGVDTVSSTLHFGPNDQHDRSDKAHAEDILSAGTFADSFHKFGVEWDENKISFTVDGKTILSITPPPGGFWELGEFNTSAVGLANPWHESYGETKMAPFDQQFYLVLDVAVGGTSFFPDNLFNFPYPKPWRDDTEFVVRDFWQARHLWYQTWHPTVNNGEDAALQINYIKVWKMKL